MKTIVKQAYTIVHFWLGNANIFKPARFNWKEQEYVEAPPLFAAILSDYTSDVSSEMSIAKFIVSKNTNFEIPAVVDPILKSESVSDMEKLDMLELIGAAFILLKGDDPRHGLLGIECWLFTLGLRSLWSTNDSSLLKMPSSSSLKWTQHFFGKTTEFTTRGELMELFTQVNIEGLEIQALLVTQRIMSRICTDPHPFFIRCLLQYGRDWFYRQSHYIPMTDIVLVILEPFHARQWDEVVNHDWCFKIVIFALCRITYSSWMMYDPPPNSSELPFANFIEINNYISALLFKLQTHPDATGKYYYAVKMLVSFLMESVMMFTTHNKEECQEFKQLLSDYISFINSHPDVFNVLHAVCKHSELKIKIIQLFLKGGVDPNATDLNGNTALHHLAMNENCEDIEAAVRLLLDAGSHLDQANLNGRTPLDFFTLRQLKFMALHKRRPDPFLHSLINTVLPLSCYCAQVIRQNSIPFEDPRIPPLLVSFILKHSSKSPSKIHP